MIRGIPFRTRARTIDHLGREQIADCPTAISELWKNAYDAYARSVALHVFDGEPVVAAIVDDGHGMSREEIIERWLVVGTESKAAGEDTPKQDRFGLPERARQGQKGIGRLSVAALGYVTLLISKRVSQAFAACLIDWRLFENPYLNLEDILIPVEEFSEPSDLAKLLPQMLDVLIDNVWGRESDAARNNRISSAWRRHDKNRGKSDPKRSDQIAASAIAAWVTESHLSIWPPMAPNADLSKAHGTALFTLHATDDLEVWTKPEYDDDKQYPAVRLIKDLLERTLDGFVDPYLEKTHDFDYQVTIHDHSSSSRVLLSNEKTFNREELLSLEHYVDGRFDSRGAFSGTVRAFNRAPQAITFTPQVPPPLSGEGYVGPFGLVVGTFEQMAGSSAHGQTRHAQLAELAEKHSGIRIYRDSIRIMPYGRPDADFFGLEERRSKHAGREFWSHRRSFGRVSLSYFENRELRDKAGREGLIDNASRRWLRILVVELLMHAARKYFGDDSEAREQYLPEIKALNTAAKNAEERAAKRRLGSFREAMRTNARPLAEAGSAVRDVSAQLNGILQSGKQVHPAELDQFDAAVNELAQRKAQFRLPPKPAKLGKLEENYRSYRDSYSDYCAQVDALQQSWTTALEKYRPRSWDDQARSALSRHQKYLHDELSRFSGQIEQLFKRENSKVQTWLEEDRPKFYATATPHINELVDGQIGLAIALNRLEMIREAMHQEFLQRYTSYQRALEQLADNIDIDAALTWNSDQRAELERRLEQIQSLAQLGVTVEIIGHELNELEEDVGRNLRRFPRNVQELDAYKHVKNGHRMLMERLRFLAPIKLSGPRLYEPISGAEIFKYLQDFFASQLEARRAKLVATDAFLALKLSEQRARLYPTFVNLVNNSLYWLTFVDTREVRLDLVGNAVVVSDTGKGVDVDDLPSLFQLFFTRKVAGRGVGLYLCRANLELGGHRIEYATNAQHRILSGANFVIYFNGVGS